MIKLSSQEREISKRINLLKEASGSHSPSIFTFQEKIPELKVEIDACFLSNPYATDLFISYFNRELLATDRIRDVLEFYPSQNEVIAESISSAIGVNKESIFVGNGAIEIIQAVIHNFVQKKIVVNIPTFSSYYEFCKDGIEVVYFNLEKANNYLLDPAQYVEFVKSSGADSVVIINPNNPNGGYLNYSDLRYLVNNLRELDNIIIDESFIHFAYESEDMELLSATDLSREFPNVIVVKSMSKDFGVAGMRAGYGIMDKKKVRKLLDSGYLWNVSGLSEYFFRLYARSDFLTEYDEVRKKYIKSAHDFFDQLRGISQIKVYPTMANFALIEILDGSSASDFVAKLLIKYGIYSRTGSDKIGLDGELVRVAARTKEENEIIVVAIKDIFNEALS